MDEKNYASLVLSKRLKTLGFPRPHHTWYEAKEKKTGKMTTYVNDIFLLSLKSYDYVPTPAPDVSEMLDFLKSKGYSVNIRITADSVEASLEGNGFGSYPNVFSNLPDGLAMLCIMVLEDEGINE